ncbi:hypothetical protein L596_029321 [Steinernema carpocapsae]|uniref:G-protein coupled receptors family 1 profile domain-containing protein n=1 Tax=Steinernema carpocapsae TaxID=34508 RepID=A0A4U5LU99_STECR|nr:hypothetical protein L596_029321 [Steinernema carpocapsae]
MLNQWRFSTAVFELSVPLVFLPIYLMLIWIFRIKPEFKNLIAYKIIVSLGLMDCFYLLQTLAASFLTLFAAEALEKDALDDENPLRVFIKVVSSFRNGHLLAVPFLTLALAVNRLMVMLNNKYLSVGNKRYTVIICIAWFIYIPLVLLLEFFNTGIKFDLTVDHFTYRGPFIYNWILGYGGPALEIASLCCMFGVVTIILVQKRLFRTNVKVSPVEVRLITQSLFICLPISFISITGLVLGKEMPRIPWLNLTWNNLAAVIPVINLAVYIVFNPYMTKMLLCKKESTIVQKWSAKWSKAKTTVSIFKY